MALSSSEFIKRYRSINRKKYYGLLDRMSDKAVYDRARKQYPNLEVSPFTPTETVKTVDTSPSTMNKLGQWVSDMSDYIIDENSWDVHKYSFNNSMTGAAHKLATGKEKYPDIVGTYQPNLAQEIYAGLLSFTFPLDALTFVGSGGYGAWAGKGIAKQLGMKWTQVGAKKKMQQRMLESSLGLGFYMGAANTVAEAAEQRVMVDKGELDKFDYDKLAYAGMEGYAEGSMLGVAVGGVGSTFSKQRAKILKNIKYEKSMETN